MEDQLKQNRELINDKLYLQDQIDHKLKNKMNEDEIADQLKLLQVREVDIFYKGSIQSSNHRTRRRRSQAK